MAEPETTTAIMLDQAEVDAAEASHAAQETGGDDGEYIGRRPSSSGRDSKRYRKCCLLACSHARGHRMPLYGLERVGAFTAQPSCSSHTQPLHLFLLRNQHESKTPHTPRAVTFQQGLCNG